MFPRGKLGQVPFAPLANDERLDKGRFVHSDVFFDFSDLPFAGLQGRLGPSRLPG